MTKYHVILYIATFILMVALDLLWLKGVASSFYKARLGDLLEFHPIPGVIFYVIYVAGILIFASASADKWQTVAMYAALFGFLAYATYDLTNLATLRGWSVSLSLVDMAWGTFTTAFSATAGWFIAKSLAS